MKTSQQPFSRLLTCFLIGYLILVLAACGSDSNDISSLTDHSSTPGDTLPDTATHEANVVNTDLANLLPIFTTPDSITQVTQNIFLSLNGALGSTIHWSSSNINIITNSGLVTRPDFLKSHQSVTLTATITYNNTSRKKTFDLTVLKQAPTDTQIVSSDYDNLSVIFAPNDSLNHVTQNILLPNSISLGSSISWSSSDTNIITNTGLVTPPDFLNTDQIITLTAVITYNETSRKKTFQLTVIKKSPTEAQIVSADYDNLSVIFAPNDNANGVRQDLFLATLGTLGSTISWSSSNTNIITNSGLVTLPETPQTITLTATLTYNNTHQQKTFTLTVLKAPFTDLQIVTNDYDHLSLILAPNDHMSSITQNITLPTRGDMGSTISWLSNNSDIISHSGVVNRSGNQDTFVTLTATLQHNTQSLIRTFELTVLKTSGIFYALCEGTWPTMLPEPSDQIESWVVATDGTTESSIFWNPLKNQSLHYQPVVQPNDWGSGLNLDTYGKSETILRYNSASDMLNSMAYNSGAENHSVIESGQFNHGKVVTIYYEGLNASDHVIGQSASLNLTIGKSYPDRTRFLLGERTTNPSQVTLTWCPVSSASAYTLYHGNNPTNLTQQQTLENIQNITLSDMPTDQNIYFRIQATNAEGEGRLSRLLTLPPVATEMGNFSIDKLTLNQGVQIDLMDNSKNTPAIANKPGVLRVFINATQISDVKSVQVSLHGKRQNTSMDPIVREVPLQHTPFSTHDSNSLPVGFNLENSDWLSNDTEFYITIDSNNRISESDETDNRYPSTGYQSFNFQKTTPLTIKLIPTIATSGTTEISTAFMTQLQYLLLAMYPISDIVIQQGTTLDLGDCDITSYPGWSCALEKLQAYRITSVNGDSSQNDVFYYGLIAKPASGSSPSGLGSVTVLVDDDLASSPDALNAIGLDGDLNTAAHEIGHNHGRNHVENKHEDDNQDIDNDVCALPGGVDENYPYNSVGAKYGRIGITGFHHKQQQFYEKSWYHDVMSYCNKQWISDYTYKALHDFSRSLDRYFSHRETANNAYIQKIEQVQKGLKITGEKQYNQWKINHILSVNGTRHRPKEPGRYQVLATNLNGETFQETFHLHHYDHINKSGFNAFIPTLLPIKEIQIIDLNTKKIIFKQIVEE